MTDSRKALYLLADSQLLFWNLAENRFIQSIRESLQTQRSSVTRAAYVGAANGDNPEFFELFKAAMDNIDLHESRMISSQFNDEDCHFLQDADLILLAGGSVRNLAEVFDKTGMGKVIVEKYYTGSVLVGISAGAIQLGLGVSCSDDEDVNCLKLFPYYVDVNQEKNDWYALRHTLEKKGEYDKGFGISAGGGMIYHSDMVVEPLRNPLIEFGQQTNEGDTVQNSILLPPGVIGHDSIIKSSK